MTLTDFLLARIAEDQVHAELDQDRRDLAECEAKRRIIENLRPFGATRWSRAAEQTLKLLTLPYADHPDYNESWRT